MNGTKYISKPIQFEPSCIYNLCAQLTGPHDMNEFEGRIMSISGLKPFSKRGRKGERE